jgi:hypothetical protein
MRQGRSSELELGTAGRSWKGLCASPDSINDTVDWSHRRKQRPFLNTAEMKAALTLSLAVLCAAFFLTASAEDHDRAIFDQVCWAIR